MTVFRKESLLANHSFSHLTLVHAAFVDSYPVHDIGGKLSVNRLLFVRDDDACGTSEIRDLADGRILPMRAGNVYFIPCKHVIDLNIAADLHFYSLQFNLDILYGIDVMEACPRCERLRAPELVAELDRLFKNDAGIGTLCRINEMIYGFCAKWTPADCSLALTRLAKGKEYQKTIDFVRKSADATTTVESLANLMEMRADVFSRKFMKALGVSPKNFLAGAITRKAAELLMVPETSVKDVARLLNFSSEYYFSHFFKRRTGIAPQAFRRMHGGK